MMKVTLAALLLAVQASAFAPLHTPYQTSTQLNAIAGAAKSAEEDLMLTLKVIMDHAERSTTTSKDQYVQQMEESKTMEKPVEPVDLSVPYDAAAQLAFEAAGSKGDFEEFKVQYYEQAVADVMAKNAPPVDLSVPYDAAAKLAYEAAGSKGDFAAFKAQYEADAVADVIAKNKKEDTASSSTSESSGAAVVDLSIPYDATAKLAYEAAGKPGDYQAFKTKFFEDAVADVKAKQTKPEPVAA